MRIAHINVVASLSTGRIAVTLCRMAEQAGHRALLCYARDAAPSDVPSYRIGGKIGVYLHMGLARLTDRAGFFSRHATRKLVRQLEAYKPDLIHLHNLHGYYLHLPTLFAYLKKNDIPVVWTLHDCWAFTGHCAYYTLAQVEEEEQQGKRRRSRQLQQGCGRWRTGCRDCPLQRSYPSSWLVDQSARNWRDKRSLFGELEHLVLTTPSDWLRGQVQQSFLKKYPVYTLPNGLDLSTFKPCQDADFQRDVVSFYGLDQTGGRKLVLSVAAVWDERKGLDDLIDLAAALGPDYCVAAVGLDEYQIAALPKNSVLGLKRAGNLNDLCALYTAADVYVSASHEETMGMTLLEALACGTQVICYNATAMPEIVTPAVGRVVPTGDISAMADAVRALCNAPLDAADCRCRAAEYDAHDRFAAYLRLYENMYRHSPAYARALAEAEEKQRREDD